MIIAKFLEQVANYPHKAAVKVGENTYTYRELDRQSDKIAAFLAEEKLQELSGSGAPLEKQGGQQIHVGLLFDDAFSMIAAMFGVVKAGEVYIPLAADYPLARLAYIVSHACLAVILTDAENLPKARQIVASTIPVAPAGPVIIEIEKTAAKNPTHLDTLSAKAAPIEEHDLMYILYTSGSTGKPKGVMQRQCNVLHFTGEYARILDLGSADRMTLFSSSAHDAAVMDIYTSLLNGATLYPLNILQLTDLSWLSNWLVKESITVWHSVPTLYRYFVQSLCPNPGPAETYPQLRYIVLGGEAVIRYDIRRFQELFPHSLMYNLYGQTETSYNSGLFISPRQEVKRITLGQPVGGTGIFVVDSDGNEVAPLENGEIIVAHDYLSPGYFKDEAATAAAFFDASESEPATGTARIYCTGDYGSLLPDGDIEFLGRRDNQVKIRGYRVETGEIESCLLAHERIHRAAVAASENSEGEITLTAYIESGAPPDPLELEDFLSAYLPNYMIPDRFIVLEKLPLTPSGKVDRRSLPTPGQEEGRGKGCPSKFLPPQGEYEKKLAQLWAGVLKTDVHDIGRDANFFNLGGHSLRAAVLTSKIHKTFDVNVPLGQIFKTPTVKGLAGYIEAAEREKFQAIEPAEKKHYYPLSSAQRRLYFLQSLDTGSTAYNMQQMYVMPRLDPGKVQTALIQLIRRHESLRTSFHLVNGEPVQRIHDDKKIKFEIENSFTGIKAFDLSQAPLLRAALIPVPGAGEENVIFMIDLHHIISDGFSHTILLRDFQAFYDDNGSPGQLPSLRVQYKDYSQWQHSALHRERMKGQKAYWKSRLTKTASGEIPVIDLPYDYPRPPLQSFEGDAASFALTVLETQQFKQIAGQAGVTLYMALLAVFYTLLSRLSGQQDIIIGTPTAGRNHADIQHIAGMFVNTLALRLVFDGRQDFLSLLRETGKNTVEAFENQDYPFEQLLEDVDIERDMSRNPLFDVMFVLQNLDELQPGAAGHPTVAAQFAGTETLSRSLPIKRNPVSKFDLSLIIVERENSLFSRFEYCTRLFKKDTIERFISYFRNLAAAVIADPRQQVADLEMLSEAEKRRLTVEFNDTAAPYPGDKTLHLLFEEQSLRTPYYTALVYHDQHISYGELDHLAAQTAHELAVLGLQPGGIAALQVANQPWMVIAVTAVLKAQAVYLPISPDDPQERIDYMLKDSAATLLVTQKGDRQEIQKGDRQEKQKGDRQEIEEKGDRQKVTGRGLIYQTLYSLKEYKLEESKGDNQEIQQNSCHNSSFIIHNFHTPLAYVIYTSGSTGRPKGVVISHSSIVNQLSGLQRRCPFAPHYRHILLAPITFDPSLQQIYLPLVTGGKLHLVEKSLKDDPRRLFDYLLKHRIDIVNTVPSLMDVLLDQVDPVIQVNFKYIILAGEFFSCNLLEKLQSRLKVDKLINIYGPTEATINTTWYECSGSETLIPIGSPLDNYHVFVLDTYGNPTPTGVNGEICIAGPGLAQGYLNNPELTADRFIIYNVPPGAKTLFEKRVLDSQKLLFSRGAADRQGARAPRACLARTAGSLDPSAPCTPGPFLYKTGDKGRWQPNGTLLFAGRIDRQVKIRGIRVELEEIEKCLLEHPAVEKAAVIASTSGSGRNTICAYIAVLDGDAKNGKQPPADNLTTVIREYLSKILPPPMVPAYFVLLPEIPLTAHGKVDVKALPPLDREAMGLETSYAPPGDEMEKKVAAAWKEVLEVDQVGRHDNFFEIGGNSLDIIKVCSRLKELTGREVPVVSLFRFPTVETLARCLQQPPGATRSPGGTPSPAFPAENPDRSEILQRGRQDRSTRLQMRKKIGNT